MSDDVRTTGSYHEVDPSVLPMADRLVERTGVSPDDRVLDVRKSPRDSRNPSETGDS